MFDIYPGQECLFPELRLFECKKVRADALRDARRAALKGGERLAMGLAGGVCGAIFGVWLLPRCLTVFNLLAPEALRFPGLYWIAKGLTFFFFILALAFWPVHLLTRTRIHRHLRRRLNELGMPICIECGYRLTGLDSPRCPECGEPFSERKR